MSVIYVKLKQRTSNNKYRKMLSIDEPIYCCMNSLIKSCIPYAPSIILGEEEWFCLTEEQFKPYANGVLDQEIQTVDFDSLERHDFDAIDFIIVDEQDGLYFQNVTRAKLVARKSILCFGENFKYERDRHELVINELPDAIYSRTEKCLYFRKLESITGIFKGIDQLFREATENEVRDFLGSDFILLRDGYNVSAVKTPNRKRIALVKDIMGKFTKTDKMKIFSYIDEYCSTLSQRNGVFEIGNEEDLKMLLYGIEQRFYTTPIGGEKRLANSVIPL